MTQAERDEYLASVAGVLELVTSDRWTPDYAEDVMNAAISRIQDEMA